MNARIFLYHLSHSGRGSPRVSLLILEKEDACDYASVGVEGVEPDSFVQLDHELDDSVRLQ